MSIRRANHNFGLSTNIEVSPQSSSNSNPVVNNHIVIGDAGSANISKENLNSSEKLYPEVNTAMVNAMGNPYASSEFRVKDQCQTRDVKISSFGSIGASSPERAFQEPTTNENSYIPISTQIESKLLSIYMDILLNNNKILLSNIVSTKKIILTKNDLEEIISIQTGKQCEVILKPFESSCLSKISPFDKIDSIKITDQQGVITDFKHAYNKEYNELLDHYCLCLKLVAFQDA